MLNSTENVCTPAELARRRTTGCGFLVLDVRTRAEWDLARIEPATLIPLDELPGRLNELGAWRDREILVLCHHGVRSAMAQQFLQANGFANVRNITGGIDAYAAEQDASVPRY